MGGGVQPHFCPWKNVCFPIFPHGEKWEKKCMERDGKVFISLSFHILFSLFFLMGKNGKTHIFPWAKMGLDPPKIFGTKKVSGQNYLILKKSAFYRQNCNFGPIWVKWYKMFNSNFCCISSPNAKNATLPHWQTFYLLVAPTQIQQMQNYLTPRNDNKKVTKNSYT